MHPFRIVQPIGEQAQVLGLARRRVGRSGLYPAEGLPRHGLPATSQHHARMALAAPCRHGHVSPEFAVGQVMLRERSDLDVHVPPACATGGAILFTTTDTRHLAHSADPNNPLPWLFAAQELFKAKQTAEAVAEIRAAIERFPRHAALKRIVARRGVAIREDVRAPLRGLTHDERRELDTWLDASS